MTKNTILPLFIFILIAFSAIAKEKKVEDVPDVLDFDRRQASLMRFEISPYTGDYFGDKLNHSFTAGGDLQFNLNESIAIATDFGYSRSSVDGTSLLGMSWTNKNLFLIDGGLVYTLPAAYKSPRGLTEMDFFTSLGGGMISTNGSWHGSGYIGGGIKIRPHIRWLAIRVELRNYFTSINNPSGSNFEDDLTIRVGPTFLIPPEL